MNTNAARAYGDQQVNTASPAQMVYMLYNKAISVLQEAIKAIEANDIEARCNANGRAMEIIAHLSGTLDLEQGGEIARNLQEIYRFSMVHLMKVDRNNDAQAAQDVIGLLTPMRDSWAILARRSTDELRQAVQGAKDGNLEQQDLSQAAAAPTSEQSEGAPRSSASEDEPKQPPRPSGISISA
ncbi:flagellar export chaperone FliS [Thalassospira marina]|uniref:Flagellar export chaperone FliS n=1 Tax=Thalassospira marina TaxID=2048283 RepID=A0ABM6Q659_9PROT|nr:flagellar export chaperone FliS [Thalassospira marina]AUG51990.1 flagellar export chaperone FliS [Thalassospira marina]